MLGSVIVYFRLVMSIAGLVLFKLLLKHGAPLDAKNGYGGTVNVMPTVHTRAAQPSILG